MGLFTEFYNKVAKFFRPQDENCTDPSKSVATNRLKLVLMQDRTNLTPKILEQMRGEMVDLLSKYLEMDKDLLELNFEQDGDQVALMLSIPVIRAKDEEEIDKAIKEALAKKSENLEEDNENENTAETDSENDEDIAEDSEVEEIESISQDGDNTPETNSEEIEIDESTDSEQKQKGKRGKKVSEPEGLSGEEPPSPLGDEVSEIKQS